MKTFARSALMRHGFIEHRNTWFEVAHLLTDRKQQVRGLCSHSPITAHSCDPDQDLHWQNFSWWSASSECWTRSIINSNCDGDSNNRSYLTDRSPPLSSPVLQEMSKTIFFTAVTHFTDWNTCSNIWKAYKELNSWHSIFSIRLSQINLVSYLISSQKHAVVISSCSCISLSSWRRLLLVRDTEASAVVAPSSDWALE